MVVYCFSSSSSSNISTSRGAATSTEKGAEAPASTTTTDTKTSLDDAWRFIPDPYPQATSSSSGNRNSDSSSSSMICPVQKCPMDLWNCFIDTKCRQALTCNAQCQGRPDQVGCDLLCQFNYGYGNAPYTKLLRCMADHDCLPQSPMNGKCLAPTTRRSDGGGGTGTGTVVSNLTSYDQIQGQWWIVRGLNCGQDETWSAGFDAFPCQYDNFMLDDKDQTTRTTATTLANSDDTTTTEVSQQEQEEEEQQWIDHIGYCGGRNSTCTTPFIQTKALATMAQPGILRHDYLDAPLLPQVEQWYVLSWPHPDWMLYVYCGSTPTGLYGGGSVVTRSGRKPSDIPDWIEQLFIKVAHEHGFEYQDMCLSDTTGCPSSSLSPSSTTVGSAGTAFSSSRFIRGGSE
jgi:VDE lipocalin domain